MIQASAQVLADPVIRLQATPSLVALAKDLVRPLKEQGIEIKVLEEAGNSQVGGSLLKLVNKFYGFFKTGFYLLRETHFLTAYGC